MLLQVRRSLAQPAAKNGLRKTCARVKGGVRVYDTVIDAPVGCVEPDFGNAEWIDAEMERKSRKKPRDADRDALCAALAKGG